MVACSKIVLLATGAAALVAPPALQVRQATALAASKQEPHGGKLVNLFGDGLKAADCDTTLQMTERQSCCLLYTSPSPRDQRGSRMPSSA